MRWRTRWLIALLALAPLLAAHAQTWSGTRTAVDSLGSESRWHLRYGWTLTAAPDSEKLSYGCNKGGCANGGYKLSSPTIRTTDWWVTLARSDSVSLWVCAALYKRLYPTLNFCNSFTRYRKPALPTVVHDTVWRHDTTKVIVASQQTFPSTKNWRYLAYSTCDSTKLTVDSLTGLATLGCHVGKTPTKANPARVLASGKVDFADSGLMATTQYCMLIVLSDSSVTWAQASRRAGCSDSLPKARYGKRWHPELVDPWPTTFSLTDVVP